MVQRPRQFKENAGGIIFMYQATGVAAKNGLVDEVNLMASLSLSLAIVQPAADPHSGRRASADILY